MRGAGERLLRHHLAGPKGSTLYYRNLAIYQFMSDRVNVNIVSSPDINVDLSAIITVGGDVTISDNAAPSPLDLHNLRERRRQFRDQQQRRAADDHAAHPY